MGTPYSWLRRCVLALLGVLVPLQPLAASESDSLAPAREAFRRAYAEAHLPADRRAPDSPLLRSYPLYPYLQRARLEHALARANAWSAVDEDVRAFLQEHDAQPVSRSLRQAWLNSLVRRELWPALVEHYRPEVADTKLRCWYLRARVRVAGDDQSALAAAETEALQLWNTPRRLPPVCEPVFQWLTDRGALTPERIEQRVRALLENGEHAFARIIARRLPASRAQPLIQWADLLARPAQTLDAVLASSPKAQVEHAALLAGWKRLARIDPEAALARYDTLVAKRRMNAREASPFALALALGLAWSRHPEALVFFERVVPEDRDDYALAWEARAALWAGDWRRVEKAIAAMSDRQRSETRWKYWAARAAEQRGDTERAASLYASALPDDNFYSAKASARLGRLAQPNHARLEPEPELIQAIASRPVFVRVRELLHCELRTDAVSEWAFGYADLDERTRRQAIHLAARWGLHDVAIAAAARLGIFYDYELLYPQPYDEQVKSAAALAGVEMPLLYGLIRQESLFRPDAVSPAGAIGLAQLLPATARIVARRLEQRAPRAEELFDPAVNVRLAASYLRSLLDRFDGQIAVALAGYNAGPRAAARWLPSEPVDVDIWIENIPYNETRDYVQRVMWHSLVFAWRRTGAAQDTSAWLRPAVSRKLDAAAAGDAGGERSASTRARSRVSPVG